jgi:predicted MFS family arabinose efflux permease
VSIAFYSGALIPMITDTIEGEEKDIKLEKSMIAMIVFGIGEVCGCLFIGQMIDSYGSKTVSIINVIIVFTMTFVTLAFLGINKFNLLAFLMTFLWGVQDSTVNTHCFELCGFEFDNNTEPYSLFNFLQAMGVFIF